MEDEEYAYAKEVLEHWHSRLNTFDKYISDEKSIWFATDNNNPDCVWARILSQNEYVNEREDMK